MANQPSTSTQAHDPRSIPLTPEQEQALHAIKVKFAEDLMAWKQAYNDRLDTINREYEDALIAFNQDVAANTDRAQLAQWRKERG